MKTRIIDLSIEFDGSSNEWTLTAPIKVGSISFKTRYGARKDLDEFLNNALKLPSRRWGETPE